MIGATNTTAQTTAALRGSPLDGVEADTGRTEQAERTFPLTYEAFARARHFPALDGLRALSVLLVYLFHADPATTAIVSGWEGVTTFFLLSGFLITTLLLREHDQTGRISLPAFYARRVFRIFPLYFSVLALHYVLIVKAGIGDHGPELSRAMPYFLTYMGEWAPNTATTPFAQSWTLGIEEKYYLLWPFILLLLLRRRLSSRLGIVAVLALVPFVTAAIPIPYRQNLLTAYGRILIGCLIAICLNDKRIFNRLRHIGGAVASWLVLAAFVGCLLLVYPVNGAIDVFPFVAGLLLISLIVGNSAAARLLSNRAVRYVGTRAYGMYLLDSFAHRAAGYVVPTATDWPTALLFFVVAAGVAFVAADVLYRIIEKPLIRLGKRVSSRLLTGPVARPLPAAAP